jgi:tRNA threonylcarbamoyladenosine biosynthesis protein TsaB
MNLLALDTSSTWCSLALLAGEKLIVRDEQAARRHTQVMLPLIQSCLEQAGIAGADLSAIVYGQGPGSFTGLRIAASCAQGLAFGWGVPVVPVSSLQAMAQSALETHGAERVLVAIDARMDEVYWGAYQVNNQGIMMPTSSDGLCSPEDLPPPSQEYLGVGDAWDVYGSRLGKGERLVYDVQNNTYPSAAGMAKIAANALKDNPGLPAEQALPVYCRQQVAKRPA